MFSSAVEDSTVVFAFAHLKSQVNVIRLLSAYPANASWFYLKKEHSSFYVTWSLQDRIDDEGLPKLQVTLNAAYHCTYCSTYLCAIQVHILFCA